MRTADVKINRKANKTVENIGTAVKAKKNTTAMQKDVVRNISTATKCCEGVIRRSWLTLKSHRSEHSSFRGSK